MIFNCEFFSGPGAGKSTTSAGLFFMLKNDGIDCEIITEKAKDLTWERNLVGLGCQPWVSSTQIYRQERVEGHVDVITTDSPILLGLYYNKASSAADYHFKQFLVETYKAKNNLTVFLKRRKGYNPNGRNQTEDEAVQIDNDLKYIMHYHDIPYIEIDGDKDGTQKLYKMVKERLDVTN